MPKRSQTASSYNPLAFLNAFRIFAAFGVFLIHYSVKNTIDSCPFMRFIYSGIEPVCVFFVISGVLFFFAYYIKIRDNQTTFKDFFLKRLIRLWPLLILVAICNYVFALSMYFAGQQVPPEMSTDILEFFLAIFFAGPALFNGEFGKVVGVSWYIAILMFCYLVAFLLTKLDKKIKNKIIFLPPLILGAVMIILGCKYPFFNNLLGHGLFSFFLGFYVAFILQKFATLSNKPKTIIRICALILPIFYVVMFNFPDLANQIFVHRVITVPLTFIAPLFFVFYDLKWFNKISNIKPIKYLSNISYDFYLLQMAAIGPLLLVDKTILDTWWMILATLLLAIALAVISNIFIGTKFTNYLNKKLGYGH